MRELPALFNAPMVRAILEGRKTVTRRLMKPQPEYRDVAGLFASWVFKGGYLYPNAKERVLAMCTYGRPGDHLWVRETFHAWGRWETRYNTKKGRDEWHFIDLTLESGKVYRYEVDMPDDNGSRARGGVTPTWWKRPAIFMPRVASRIELEVTSVRVERLQAITQEDASAEGVHVVSIGSGYLDRYSAIPATWAAVMEGAADAYEDARIAFRDLWQSINGSGSWKTNPWVWVVEFQRVQS